MDGLETLDFTNAFWDDGEWVRWDSLIEPPDKFAAPTKPNEPNPELQEIFDLFVEVARKHKDLTGNYLQVWGELGELYAELNWGIRRHRPNTQGSDGKLGNDFVEVKTISPEKSVASVQVKRAGNFNKLLIVKISAAFSFEARIAPRRALRQVSETHDSIAWAQMPDSKT